MAVPGAGAGPGINRADSTRERWRRVEDLFNAASELDPRDRTAFLRAMCHGDDALRSEVESLLRAADHTLGMLRRPVESVARSIGGADLTHRRIGNFEVIKLIGAGGMGEVYLGARADDQFRQRVAIKLMRFGLDRGDGLLGQAMVSRFLAERQILANLDHPNIARLLDGGLTPEGWPYLVMELVEGVPFDQFCRDEKLSTNDRIRLFQQVCDAIEYTHQNLVVHRDIKPSNILVTRKRVPKLLDFGIAHLLDVDQSPEDSSLMTPGYASPEQILGKPITTATDVFGLGVLLYEMLTGGLPFIRPGEGSEDLAVAICHKPPRPLSDVARENPAAAAPDARKWTPELTAILLRALAKDPAERYRTVARLSDDLSAYRERRPVAAYSESWQYRTRRYIARHRWAVGFAALFVAGLIATSVFMALLLRQANEEKAKSEMEARFLAGIFQSATPSVARGEAVTARSLLDNAARRIDTAFPNSPDVRATLLGSVAQAYEGLGAYPEAEKAAERAYRLKMDLLGPGNAETQQTLFDYANVIRLQGQYAQAEPLFRQLVQRIKEASGSQSRPYARALTALGECLYWESKDAEAEPTLRDGLAAYRRLGPDEGPEARNYLALELERKGQYREAVTLLEEAVAIDRRVEGTNSPEYAISLHNLGSARIDIGDLSGAETRLREALAIRRRVLGDKHPDLGYSLNNLGYVLLEKGDWQAAEPYFREALILSKEQLGEHNPRLASHVNNWARYLQAKGDLDEAADTYQQALDILRRANSLSSWAGSSILLNVASLEFDRRNYPRAESLARQALEMRRKLGGDGTPAVAAANIDLAEDELVQGDIRGALPLLNRALDIRREKLWPNHPAVIAAEVRVGEALVASGNTAAAEPLLRQALAAAQSAPFPLLPWQIAETESALAACLAAQGKTQEADTLTRVSDAPLATHPRPAFRTPAALRIAQWVRASRP